MKDLNYYISHPQDLDKLQAPEQIKLYQTLLDKINEVNNQIATTQAKISVYQQEYDTKLNQLLKETNQPDLPSLETYLNNQQQVLLNTLKDYTSKLGDIQNKLSTINNS